MQFNSRFELRRMEAAEAESIDDRSNLSFAAIFTVAKDQPAKFQNNLFI